MVSAKDLSPSSGTDIDTLTTNTTTLVDHGRWRLCNEGKGLERQFRFKTFKATWDFMNQVAAECKKQKHHPEWTNVYNRTHVRWTTHNPEGLSGKDVEMARFCDRMGEEFGEIDPEPKGNGVEGGKDGVKIDGRECCAGKAKGV